MQHEDGFVATVARDVLHSEVWNLTWQGPVTRNRAYRMVKSPENAALRGGGYRLTIHGGKAEEALRDLLARWPVNIVTETETGYVIELIVAAEDGYVHDDLDDSTPLNRITCPTCVERIAHRWIDRREEAFGENLGPQEIGQHTRRVAEAFTRLAEIEENLKLGSDSSE